jgi:hypothetical protein
VVLKAAASRARWWQRRRLRECASASAVEVEWGWRPSGRWPAGGRGVGNQELGDLTIGVYEARRLAVQRLHAEARKLDASGVIALDLWGGPAGTA